MRYVLFIAMLTFVGNAFSQETTKTIPPDQTDINWVKAWGESAARLGAHIQKNAARTLELNKEIQQLRAADGDDSTEKLIEIKLKMIERLTQTNIQLAKELQTRIEIQRKGLPQTE